MHMHIYIYKAREIILPRGEGRDMLPFPWARVNLGLTHVFVRILDSRTGRGIPKMPVDRLIETRKENGVG